MTLIENGHQKWAFVSPDYTDRNQITAESGGATRELPEQQLRKIEGLSRSYSEQLGHVSKSNWQARPRED